jgi:hypothetical protein
MGDDSVVKYCTVRGRWTAAISDIDTTCRFYSGGGVCSKDDTCEFKTDDSNVVFIGKKVKAVHRNGLDFEDGSAFRWAVE